MRGAGGGKEWRGMNWNDSYGRNIFRVVLSLPVGEERRTCKSCIRFKSIHRRWRSQFV